MKCIQWKQKVAGKGQFTIAEEDVVVGGWVGEKEGEGWFEIVCEDCSLEISIGEDSTRGDRPSGITSAFLRL